MVKTHQLLDINKPVRINWQAIDLNFIVRYHLTYLNANKKATRRANLLAAQRLTFVAEGKDKALERLYSHRFCYMTDFGKPTGFI